jgi:hypothetical protein
MVSHALNVSRTDNQTIVNAPFADIGAADASGTRIIAVRTGGFLPTGITFG